MTDEGSSPLFFNEPLHLPLSHRRLYYYKTLLLLYFTILLITNSFHLLCLFSAVYYTFFIIIINVIKLHYCLDSNVPWFSIVFGKWHFSIFSSKSVTEGPEFMLQIYLDHFINLFFQTNIKLAFYVVLSM